jgi:polyhydroxyalkanoate synthase
MPVIRLSDKINSIKYGSLKMNENDSGDDKTNQDILDKIGHIAVAKLLGWFSPSAFQLSLCDWYLHFMISPGKHIMLSKSVLEEFKKLLDYSMTACFSSDCQAAFECRSTDKRFEDESWNHFPFNLFYQNFLFWERFLDKATTDVRGVSDHHLHIVNFLSRQMLDMISPSNFPLTNPEILSETMNKKGNNLLEGYNNLVEDASRILHKKPPVGTEKFKVGVELAITPGKIVYRNKLIELIQYDPVEKQVDKEPILITPAWIMKYYILDLSPKNSMVKYLVEQGHTVFMISWKNPTGEDRDLGLDDYVNLGFLSALDVINKIVPDSKVNAVGYCIGGTLLMIAAAYMAEMNDDRLNSITLFAAQVDFKAAGELLLFIDESQIAYLEDIMWEKGYLDGAQMAGTFSMLHSIDLIWSRAVRNYYLGERDELFDLMAWDYDTTRLPYRMHSEYLRKLFLKNDLSEERFSVNGKRVYLSNINTPIFAVSTVTDHVAPWKSVYKVHHFTNSEITFVLTSGGHNAGIVSEPGHPHRNFQIQLMHAGAKPVSSEKWQKQAPSMEGSWWPEWHRWLQDRSTSKIPAPSMGNPEAGYAPLCDAPGTYVLMK